MSLNRIEFQLPPPEFLSIQDRWVAVNKPGGVLTQAPPGIDSIELRVIQWRQRERDAAGEIPPTAFSSPPYLGVPHRLDRPVSGALLLGLTRNQTRRWADLFQRREVEKFYWAVVEGVVPENSGRWSDFMRKIPDQAKSEIVSADHPEAQLAILNFHVLGRSDRFSWLRIGLETGRTHQIRLQSAARGWPIVGDGLYGGQHSFGPATVDLRERWIALHARSLRFEDPAGGTPVFLVAPLFPCWDCWLKTFPEMQSRQF